MCRRASLAAEPDIRPAWSYEVHILTDKQAYANCFATPEDVTSIAAGDETEILEVFTEVADDASVPSACRLRALRTAAFPV